LYHDYLGGVTVDPALQFTFDLPSDHQGCTSNAMRVHRVLLNWAVKFV